MENDESIQAALDSALVSTDVSGDPILAMRVLLLSAEVASEIGDTKTTASIAAEAGRVQCTTTLTDIRALAQITQAYCLLVNGDVKAALTQFRECLAVLKTGVLDLERRRASNGLGIASYYLGYFDDAIAAFRNAIKIADRIGDSVASATSWSNLGAVHEDLGCYDEAEKCYNTAFELEALASNPRRAIEVHLNLASLRMLSGQLDAARKCIDVAKRHVESAQLWWLATDVLMAEADMYIMAGDPESAWPLVEEALSNAHGRIYLLGDVGRFERLRRHYLWMKKGVGALRLLKETESLQERCVAISRRLEVLAFEEWIEETEGSMVSNGQFAVNCLLERGLRGVLDRLNAVQVIDPFR